jgi:protein tyrosine phosphatase
MCCFVVPHTHGPQVWETESAGIFNLTECVKKCVKCVEKGADFVKGCSTCVDKCAQYWPDAIDETIPFILGEEGTHGARSISVTRIAKDPLQVIIDDIEEGLSSELESSQACETRKLQKMITDKEKFEIRTFRLEYDGKTREVTQYHVKFWNDNTGLLGDDQIEMRDFLHFWSSKSMRTAGT